MKSNDVISFKISIVRTMRVSLGVVLVVALENVVDFFGFAAVLWIHLEIRNLS